MNNDDQSIHYLQKRHLKGAAQREPQLKSAQQGAFTKRKMMKDLLG